MLRTITAKYPNTCASCGKPINKGDRVRWNGNGKVYCLTHSDHKPAESTYPAHVILIGKDGGVNVYRPDWTVFSDIAAMLNQDALVSTSPAFKAADKPADLPVAKPVYEPVKPATVPDTIPYVEKPSVDPMAAMFAKLAEMDA